MKPVPSSSSCEPRLLAVRAHTHVYIHSCGVTRLQREKESTARQTVGEREKECVCVCVCVCVDYSNATALFVCLFVQFCCNSFFSTRLLGQSNCQTRSVPGIVLPPPPPRSAPLRRTGVKTERSSGRQESRTPKSSPDGDNIGFGGSCLAGPESQQPAASSAVMMKIIVIFFFFIIIIIFISCNSDGVIIERPELPPPHSVTCRCAT